MEKRILITGASGLLGRALVQQFLREDFFVFAQYHSTIPVLSQSEKCNWIAADFSTIDGIREFLKQNVLSFRRCSYLINNYGPITYKDTHSLTSHDLYNDFHHNVITSFEITDFFIRHTQLKSVVNIGYQGINDLRPYKKILPYAAAKNALHLITLSCEEAFRDAGIRFRMVSPPTMQGADVKAPTGPVVPAATVAHEIFRKITSI